MKRYFVIAALAAALAAPAFAQQGQQQQQQQQMQRLQGTVEDMRYVQTEQRQRHLVLRVQPEGAWQREYKFVDLGDAREVKNQNIQIERGDNISISGQRGQIRGRPVLVAEQIAVEGQQYALDTQTRRPGGLQEPQRQDRMRRMHQQYVPEEQRRQRGTPRSQRMGMDREQMDRMRQEHGQRQRTRDPFARETGQRLPVIRGEVVSMRDFSIQGVQDRHRLIKISDAREPGRTWIVDLGPTNAVQQLNLQEGDRILVRGQRGRVEGRPILRATQIAQFIDLEREFQTQQQSQRQEDQAQQSARARQQQEQ